MGLFKDKIRARYKITDLGPISWVLGMKVIRDRVAQTISLSQEPYVDAIISKYNFSDLKPVSIPMDPSIQLLCTSSAKSIADTTRMRNIPYRAAVGLLMYLAICHDRDRTYPYLPYPDLSMPILSHQNHSRAPNAKPEPSGSILSQLTSNTSPNPLTPLHLSNALPNTLTPLHLANAFLT